MLWMDIVTVGLELPRKEEDEMSELMKAFVKAQAELKNPAMDSTDPHFKSKFASLKAVREAVYPVFNKHGLAIVHKGVQADTGLAINTVVIHESGEDMDCGTLFIPVRNDNPQSYCSAMTYARRYTLQGVAGVVGDPDDDGSGAAQTEGKAKAEAKGKKPTEKKLTKAEIDFRKTCGGAKKAIGDEGYYSVLGDLGFAKASEVGNKEDRDNVLKALRTYYEMNKDA